jgi:hypothetical protein
MRRSYHCCSNNSSLARQLDSLVFVSDWQTDALETCCSYETYPTENEGKYSFALLSWQSAV